jgi:hypothetical protein
MSDDPHIPPTTKALDEAGGRALVEAWQASGLSGAQFCRQHTIRPQRLHYWRERLGYPMRVVGSASGRSVDVRPASQPSAPEGFVQVVVGAPVPSPSTHVDIVMGGAVVRVRPGFDAGLLRDVVQAIGAPS